ncbi:MAG: fructose-6-phosphate aldolase [Rickettsiales bacterium]|nr:fructose-6-phosphate aldolase [Rickettsiales bacterium]
MKIFLDTTDLNEIKFFNDIGIIDGITTNPSLIAKSGKGIFKVIKQICEIVSGSVSAEVVSSDTEGMIEEGLRLSKIASNVAIKIPMTWEGLKACKYLSGKGIKVNVTLCFSGTQALLAAKAGASFVSIFVGRQDDISNDGIQIVSDIKEVYDQYPGINSQVLVASVRHPLHVYNAAQIGADICTIPPKIMKQLLDHPLTVSGIRKFLQDFKESQLAKS